MTTLRRMWYCGVTGYLRTTACRHPECKRNQGRKSLGGHK